MLGVRPCPLPPQSLLQRYAASGAFTDCYAAELPRRISHGEFVEAFYTSALFKLERLILRWGVAKPSTDAQAAQLACAQTASFAAWSVEERTADQLLLCDFVGRTRSWLMVLPSSATTTRLLFGSALVPRRDRAGQPRMGAAFTALLGFHKAYSQLLLAAAARRLRERRSTTSP